MFVETIYFLNSFNKRWRTLSILISISPNFQGLIPMKNALTIQVGMLGDMFSWLVANLKQGVIYFIKQALPPNISAGSVAGLSQCYKTQTRDSQWDSRLYPTISQILWLSWFRNCRALRNKFVTVSPLFGLLSCWTQNEKFVRIRQFIT